MHCLKQASHLHALPQASIAPTCIASSKHRTYMHCLSGNQRHPIRQRKGRGERHRGQAPKQSTTLQATKYASQSSLKAYKESNKSACATKQSNKRACATKPSLQSVATYKVIKVMKVMNAMPEDRRTHIKIGALDRHGVHLARLHFADAFARACLFAPL